MAYIHHDSTYIITHIITYNIIRIIHDERTECHGIHEVSTLIEGDLDGAETLSDLVCARVRGAERVHLAEDFAV
jgi:hypothetical protein